MKFKVGDKVRLNIDGIFRHLSFPENEGKDWIERVKKLSEGFKIVCEGIELNYSDKNDYRVKEEHLELVPEEPEFKYWEEIEVGDEDWRRRKRIFLLKIPWNVIDPYVVVERGSNERFQFGESYDVEVWRFARKPRSSLTRKEIAEKFWVSEDFVLVD